MRYFVVQGNDELGPFDEDELRELSEQGHLHQSTYIRTEDGVRSGMLPEILPLIASKMTALEKASSALPQGVNRSSETRIPTAADPQPIVESGFSKWTVIGSLVIAAAGLFFFIKRGKWTFFDGIDLIFHEAGHLVLGFTPQFIVALAGTLFQLLIPGFLAIYFHRREKMFATQFCMMWSGQSLLNVSNYLADARAQALPLVGGGEHDWTYLLGEMGVLQHDVSIGKFLNGIALLIFAVATCWPWLCQWWESRRNEYSE